VKRTLVGPELAFYHEVARAPVFRMNPLENKFYGQSRSSAWQMQPQTLVPVHDSLRQSVSNREIHTTLPREGTVH
jgi:hypothetical protein